MRRPGTIRRSLLGFPLWLISVSCCLASISPAVPGKFHQTQAPIAAFRHSQVDGTNPARCAASQPPEALATPDPLLDPLDSQSRVAVSFIVGLDGRVHSPVVLESAGSAEDSRVLQALRIWRYRPGTCNAAPTETESKVEFSSR